MKRLKYLRRWCEGLVTFREASDWMRSIHYFNLALKYEIKLQIWAAFCCEERNVNEVSGRKSLARSPQVPPSFGDHHVLSADHIDVEKIPLSSVFLSGYAGGEMDSIVNKKFVSLFVLFCFSSFLNEEAFKHWSSSLSHLIRNHVLQHKQQRSLGNYENKEAGVILVYLNHTLNNSIIWPSQSSWCEALSFLV